MPRRLGEEVGKRGGGTARLRAGGAKKTARPARIKKPAPAAATARLKAELREALDRQKATAEVLRAISSSRGRLKPVFDTVLGNALRLCDAEIGSAFRVDGDELSIVSMRGARKALEQHTRRLGKFRPPADGAFGRAIRQKKPVQIRDMRASPMYAARTELAVAAVELGGIRTLLYVPMVKDGAVLGVLTVYRREVRPFSAKQIGILADFAAQAVIAIENARLLTELRESLDRQTATAEVLSVISASPGELGPVFDTMIASAIRICDASVGVLFRRDGDILRPVAEHGEASGALTSVTEQSFRPHPQSNFARVIATKATVHTPDLKASPEYALGVPGPMRLVDELGVRAVLHVPLVREDELIGVFNVYRMEARSFTDKQIELVENFAAQAVIAIENARLLTELRDSLDRQTATAEVLGVISSSPGNLAPVFETMLDRALRICEAQTGILYTRDGDAFAAIAASGVPETVRQAVHHAAPLPGSNFAAMVETRATVHCQDLRTSPAYLRGDPGVVAAADVALMRSVLYVPLNREADLIGALIIFRNELRPFEQKQIELVENFAKQAVIAIENARLLTELRESLDRQTATSEILGVISASPGALEPVFEAILDNALRLSETQIGHLYRIDADGPRLASLRGAPPAYAEVLRRPERFRLAPDAARAIEHNEPVQVPDLGETQAYRERLPRVVAAVELGGARTTLYVPMVREGQSVGIIIVQRNEVRAFSEKQIELVENFAKQAVIAIENARLLTELRDSLERQTATSDVLRIISSSPGDAMPVFETILDNVTRLCNARHGYLHLFDGEVFRPVAQRGLPEDFIRDIRWGAGGTGVGRDPASPLGRLAATRRTVHVVDLLNDPTFRDDGSTPEQAIRARVARIGARSYLVVPMLKDDALVGSITIYHQEVRPFTDKQIELVENFAAQAVIAIENARLLTELRESLDRQTATADILRVIASTPGDPSRALDTIAETAGRIFGASNVHIRRREGDVLRVISSTGLVSEATRNEMPDMPIVPSANSGRCIIENRQIHIDDAALSAAGNAAGRLARDLGIRTQIFTPLTQGGKAIGVMIVNCDEVRPFQPDQLELMRGFADQAVIAIENARLLTELRESLDRQTATSEVLGVISASPGEPGPVFETMLDNAVRLCAASQGSVFLLEGVSLRRVATRNLPADLVALGTVQIDVGPPERMVRTRATVHVSDLLVELADNPDMLSARIAVEQGGTRTVLWVPLIKDDAVVGAFVLNREEVRPFTDKQIALVENFAAQAVIAIDNTRLLTELRARTDELAQRQAELRVTFDNMGDGVAMFDAEQRLVSWNRNLQEILDLPDGFFGQPRTFQDYITFLIERGEFGAVDLATELERYADIGAVARRIERTRPDGRVLEIRNNPVPGGGFVTIYSDVTERKRAEAQVHAARDAAEKALGDLKAAQASLVQAEKMASLGQLTAGIAHEIKNPLNFVNNFAGLSVELLGELKEAARDALAVLGEEKRAEIDEVMAMLTSNLEKISEHGRRADGIVKSMLAHSRGGSGERQSVNINALVEESLNLAYHGARAHDQNFNITLEQDLDAAITPIDLVPQDITRVFLNLFGNGFYAANKRRLAAGNGFKPVLKVSTRDLGAEVAIRVRDNGIGIAPEIREKLFEPFFTTKPTGEGTGLGLSISYEIVTRQHGGAIDVASEPGAFTEFTVRLPRKLRTP